MSGPDREHESREGFDTAGAAAPTRTRSSPRIEFLWWRGCPSSDEALAGLREAVRAVGLDPDSVEVREVTSQAGAEAESFIGSPTIRIDGADIRPPGPDEPLGLTCRIYRLRDGRVSPTPDPADVRAALERAVTGRA